MADKSGVRVMTPGKQDRISVRHIHQTKEDRKRHAKEFREDKEYKQRIKDERFARIDAERKKRGGTSGGGKNINIKVGD